MQPAFGSARFPFAIIWMKFAFPAKSKDTPITENWLLLRKRAWSRALTLMSRSALTSCSAIYSSVMFLHKFFIYIRASHQCQILPIIAFIVIAFWSIFPQLGAVLSSGSQTQWQKNPSHEVSWRNFLLVTGDLIWLYEKWRIFNPFLRLVSGPYFMPMSTIPSQQLTAWGCFRLSAMALLPYMWMRQRSVTRKGFIETLWDPFPSAQDALQWTLPIMESHWQMIQDVPISSKVKHHILVSLLPIHKISFGVHPS